MKQVIVYRLLLIHTLKLLYCQNIKMDTIDDNVLSLFYRITIGAMSIMSLQNQQNMCEASKGSDQPRSQPSPI